MSNRILRVLYLTAIAGILTFAASMEAAACPFCDEKGTTLVGQFEEAQFVLLGTFKNAQLAKNGLDMGETDFEIEKVLKTDDFIKGKTKLTLPKYVPDTKTKFIIFCDVYKGRVDPYKGMPVIDDGEMIRYLDGIMKVKGKPQPERLRHAFDFLNSPETEVAIDAYREFAKADYADYKDMAAKLPADRIAGWLRDPKTPPFRYGLYASLLGHCGNKEHAKLLLEMIEDPVKRKDSGLHGLLAAYMMLEPQKGWTLLQNMVHTKDKKFLVRYAGLLTIRFIWEYRTDLINKDEALARTEIVKAVAGVLEVNDMADFAVEDLRKWQRWEYCDQIIGMFGQKGFNTPSIRKSILRYALQCPTGRAGDFVKAQRTRDAEWVDETRELLELEPRPAATAPTSKK
jgi:hypothetical protein